MRYYVATCNSLKVSSFVGSDANTQSSFCLEQVEPLACVCSFVCLSSSFRQSQAQVDVLFSNGGDLAQPQGAVALWLLVVFLIGIPLDEVTAFHGVRAAGLCRVTCHKTCRDTQNSWYSANSNKQPPMTLWSSAEHGFVYLDSTFEACGYRVFLFSCQFKGMKRTGIIDLSP